MCLLMACENGVPQSALGWLGIPWHGLGYVVVNSGGGGGGTMDDLLLPWCLGIGWVGLWWLGMACGGLAYLEVCWASFGDLIVTKE